MPPARVLLARPVLAVVLLLGGCGDSILVRGRAADAAPDTDADAAVPRADAAVADAPDAGSDAGQDAAPDPAVAAAARQAIIEAAGSSSCFAYQWQDRGQMPPGYIKGVALVFARAACNPTRSDVAVVSAANSGDDAHDALSWYDAIFTGASMPNDTAGADTLRHAYTLLLGLGMRESSGEHCCGRDRSATNTSADTAEAGAWQTSWNSHIFSAALPQLFAKYRADASACLLEIFEEGVSCSAADWSSWGSGDGFEFQELEKSCPAFAAEYAAVMLRVSGGSAGHYGPLRTRAAEVRPECDAMFLEVQTAIEQTPAVCGLL